MISVRSAATIPAAALLVVAAFPGLPAAAAARPEASASAPAALSALGRDSERFWSVGECLAAPFPGCAPPVSERLPSSSLLPVYLHGHPGLLRHWLATRLALEASLTAALACLLESPISAALLLAAALAYLWVSPSPDSALVSWLWGQGPYVQEHYLLFILLAAVLLVWRARKPTPSRSLAAALGLGASLLWRSPLLFFPLVLAASDFALPDRSITPRRRILSIVIVAAVPYLFLIPWVHMNWTLARQFLPVEAGEADCNIATGALGIVHTVEGPWRALAPCPLPREGSAFLGGTGALLIWAARRVGEHPLSYLVACVRRAGFAVSLCPLPFSAAVLFLWLYRDKKEFRALGLLLAYFIGIHCLMSVQSRYFIPMAPLLLAASAAGAVKLSGLEGKGGRLQAAGAAFALGAAGAALALALALSAYSWGRVDAYRRWAARAHEALSDAQWDRLVRARPGDPWIAAARGERRLKEGRWKEAERDLSRALELAPASRRWRIEKAWALARLGRPEELLGLKDPQASGNWIVIRALFQADELLREKRLVPAGRRLRAAVEEILRITGVHGEMHEAPDADRAAAARLSEEGSLWSDIYEWAFERMPWRDRLRLELEILKLAPRTGFSSGLQAALRLAARGLNSDAARDLAKLKPRAEGFANRISLLDYWGKAVLARARPR